MKLQFKCSANYKDIKNIEIDFKHKNSKGQEIPIKGKGSSMPIKYLEITLANGRKKRFILSYYTRNQFIKMLNLIIHNMQVSGNTNVLNIDEIMMEWHSLFGKKDKQINYLL